MRKTSLLFLTMVVGASAAAASAFEIRARGTGKAPARLRGTPQGRLMARRAARIVAMRNLLARLEGVVVVKGKDGRTTELVRGILRGAREVDRRRVGPGIWEVTVAVDARSLLDAVREHCEAQLRRLTEENAHLRKKNEEFVMAIAIMRETSNGLMNRAARLKSAVERMERKHREAAAESRRNAERHKRALADLAAQVAENRSLRKALAAVQTRWTRFREEAAGVLKDLLKKLGD